MENFLRTRTWIGSNMSDLDLSVGRIGILVALKCNITYTSPDIACTLYFCIARFMAELLMNNCLKKLSTVTNSRLKTNKLC